jgi:hypothetical protein
MGVFKTTFIMDRLKGVTIGDEEHAYPRETEEILSREICKNSTAEPYRRVNSSFLNRSGLS